MAEPTVMDAGVIKSGETVIQTYVQRSRNGIRVDLKVAPEVEEFFKQWGGGTADRVSDYGRAWTPLQGAQPLTVWTFPGVKAEDGPAHRYNLTNIARPLVELGRDGYADTVNISFLRLVGASEGAGVSFNIEALMSRDEVEKMVERVQKACTSFYIDYLKPTNVNLQISIQPIR